METKEKKKSGLAAFYRLCPVRHTLVLLSLLAIVFHLATRGSFAVNAALSEGFVRPVHKFMSRLTGLVPFSVAECMIAAAVIALLIELGRTAAALVRKRDRLRRAYRCLMSFLAAGLGFYGGFCILWGAYFYADDFAARSGLDAGKISVGELETVTRYFAAMANDYAPLVQRDENGVCAADRAAILAQSPALYRQAQALYPALGWPEVPAKGLVCSKIMSYLDFTGFFFAFTAEANVNTDFPPSLFASTVAHELAHQRGVAKEQEANFVAVLASLCYGEADYVYSASLLAYTHLGNALYDADRAAWERVYATLSEPVLRDFAANRAYWAQFDTPVQTVSNTVYENFLYSYDQVLGLKSYGACVDLLVNYYYDEAAAALDG